MEYKDVPYEDYLPRPSPSLSLENLLNARDYLAETVKSEMITGNKLSESNLIDIAIQRLNECRTAYDQSILQVDEGIIK